MLLLPRAASLLPSRTLPRHGIASAPVHPRSTAPRGACRGAAATLARRAGIAWACGSAGSRKWRRRVSPEARCLPVRLLPRNGVPSWLLIANPPRFPSLPTCLVAKKALLPAAAAAGCLLPAVAAAAYLAGSPTTSLYSPLAR